MNNYDSWEEAQDFRGGSHCGCGRNSRRRRMRRRAETVIQLLLSQVVMDKELPNVDEQKKVIPSRDGIHS